MTVKLTKEETQEVLLLILSREGQLHRSSLRALEYGQPEIAGRFRAEHDKIMALRKKFQPKERD